MSGISSTSRSTAAPASRLIDALAGGLADTRPEDGAAVESGSRSRWQQRRNGADDRRGTDAETEEQTASAPGHPGTHGAAAPRPGTAALIGALEIDPSKGLAAARFEAVASQQARRAYEASQRVSDDRGASSGNLFDAPS